MATLVERQVGVMPTGLVAPEAPKTLGLSVATVVDRPVVGSRPAEQVGGLRPAAVESLVGAQPAATPATQEVKATPAPVK